MEAAYNTAAGTAPKGKVIMTDKISADPPSTILVQEAI
jgi:hypothetical protein